MIENIFAKISDEKIFETVVVIITDAHSLAPARVGDAGFGGDISEGAVAIVFEEMRSGLLSGREALKARAIHQKNVEPAVVVVIVESDATTRGLEQIFILMLAAVDGFCIQSRLAGDIGEAEPRAKPASASAGSSGKRETVGVEGRASLRHFPQRQCQCRLADCLEKCAARRGQNGGTFPELARA